MGRRETDTSSRCLTVNFKPLVHLINKTKELDGVQIIDRLGLPFKTIERVIPGHHQEVLNPDPVQGVENGFDLVPVLVLAGEMMKGHAMRDFSAEDIGKGRVASGLSVMERA
jgi:hypothetical protein